MNRDYHVFHDEQEYKRCLRYEFKKELLPQNITDFPAYVVYDYYFEDWRKVNFEDFIVYLKTLRDEMREMMEDINWYLDKEYDDGN